MDEIQHDRYDAPAGDTPKPFRLDRVTRPPWLPGVALGCGGLALVMILAGIFMANRFGSTLAVYFESLETTVSASLPADLPQADADRLARAFEGARARALSDDYLHPEALESISQSALRLGVSPDAATVRELAVALESLAAGGASEEEDPTPEGEAPQSDASQDDAPDPVTSLG